MKLTATPSACTRRHRWKQHLRNKPYIAALQNYDKNNGVLDKNQITTHTIISKFFSKLHKSSKFKCTTELELNMPENFCIFRNPENVLIHCGKVFNSIIDPKIKSLTVNHKKTKNFGLAPEVMFGLSVKEAQEVRKNSGYKELLLNGQNPRSKEHLGIIKDVGIVSELDAIMVGNTEYDPKLVHVFKDQCFNVSTPSLTADDNKNIAASNVIKHIKECLFDHNLELNEVAEKLFEGCIAEILDNAEEHCHTTHRAWYVRSYLNNNTRNKTLELSIFNFGDSYAETFTRLPSDSFARVDADKYVEMHKKHFNADSLYTVIALQGRISSKNQSKSDNRGQGTVKLIELFEKFYDDYKKITSNGSDDLCSRMNLITGNTIIDFDGKYKSKIKKYDNGSERVILAFNKNNELTETPNSSCIKSMKYAFFPGAMINIKLPLSSNITALNKSQRGAS